MWSIRAIKRELIFITAVAVDTFVLLCTRFHNADCEVQVNKAVILNKAAPTDLKHFLTLVVGKLLDKFSASKLKSDHSRNVSSLEKAWVSSSLSPVRCLAQLPFAHAVC